MRHFRLLLPSGSARAPNKKLGREGIKGRRKVDSMQLSCVATSPQRASRRPLGALRLVNRKINFWSGFAKVWS